MSRSAFLGAGLAVGLVASLFVGLTAPAQPDVLPSSLGNSMIGFYLDDETLVNAKPLSASAKERSLTGPFATATPGLAAFSTTWGSFTLNQSLSFVTDGVFTLYVAGRDVAHFEEVGVVLERGEDSWSGSSRLTLNDSRLLLVESTLHIPIGIDLAGAVWNVSDEIQVSIEFTGAALAESPLDIVVLYGSADTPSGLVAGVAQTGILPPSATAQPLFLANHTLTLQAPTNETDREFTVPEGDLTHLALSAEWQWGVINSTYDTKLHTDTPVTLWLKLAEDSTAGVTRDLRAALYVSSKEPMMERANVRVHLIRGDTAVQKYVLGLPTEGLLIPAGSVLRLNLTVWATEDDDLGRFAIAYGSIDHASSLTLGVPPHSPGIGRLGVDVDEFGRAMRDRFGNPIGNGTAGNETGNGTAGNGTGGPSTPGSGPGGTRGTRGTGGNGSGNDTGGPKDVTPPRNAVPGATAWVVVAATGLALAVLARRRR